MVKVAIAGASGQLARELIDRLVAQGKHEILGLVRRDPASLPALKGVTWVQTTYEDKDELVQILKGVDTVACIAVSHTDPESAMQKRLIDASVAAGVRRFMPNEFVIGPQLAQTTDLFPWWANKLIVRDYLAELNRDKKVIEYTLIHPGMFMDYLGAPHVTTTHVAIFNALFDLDHMTAIVVEGHDKDSPLSLTTVNDIANMLTLIIDYPPEKEWPVQGGFCGDTLTVAELLRIAEKVRGKPIEKIYLKMEDLEKGIVNAPIEALGIHPTMRALPPDQMETFAKVAGRGTILGMAKGVLAGSTEWNKLLPDYKFTTVEEYLEATWGGK